MGTEGLLTDVMRRRIAAVLFVVGLVVAVLAITDTGFFEDPPTEAEKVSAAVRDFYAAAEEKDYEGYCGALATEARQLLISTAARAFGTEKPNCEEVAKLAGDSFDGVVLKIRSVNVIANRARAEVSVKVPESPAEFKTIQLVREEGTWLIADQD